MAGPATLAIIGVFLVVERTWPAQPRPIFARGYRHDLLFTLVNATLVVPLVTGLTLAFVHVARTSLPWIVLPRIGLVPRWAAIARDRRGHGRVQLVRCTSRTTASRMLWRFHELHHSQEDMSVLTVFRTHPLIHVSYLVALIPGVVLLANGAMSTTVLVVYGAIVAFAHSNTRLGFGPLERIFVSPNYHRIHHKVDGPAGRQPRLRADDLGSALPPGGVPDRGHDQDRHRACRAGRSIVEQEGPRATTSLGLRRAAGRAVPSDAYATDLPPVRSEPTSRDAWETLASPRRRAAAEECEVA